MPSKAEDPDTCWSGNKDVLYRFSTEDDFLDNSNILSPFKLARS